MVATTFGPEVGPNAPNFFRVEVFWFVVGRKEKSIVLVGRRGGRRREADKGENREKVQVVGW